MSRWRCEKCEARWIPEIDRAQGYLRLEGAMVGASGGAVLHRRRSHASVASPQGPEETYWCGPCAKEVLEAPLRCVRCERLFFPEDVTLVLHERSRTGTPFIRVYHDPDDAAPPDRTLGLPASIVPGLTCGRRVVCGPLEVLEGDIDLAAPIAMNRDALVVTLKRSLDATHPDAADRIIREVEKHLAMTTGFQPGLVSVRRWADACGRCGHERIRHARTGEGDCQAAGSVRGAAFCDCTGFVEPAGRA